MRYVNLGCGHTFVTSAEWVNVDFSSTVDGVMAADLLKPLPFESGKFDLVYSSHFLEHIPKEAVQFFLLECKRILRPSGIIRLVTPDCIEMFSTYLAMREQGKHQQADFLMIEIVDQCVRARSGGQLGDFYHYISGVSNPTVKQDWMSFVFERNGEILSRGHAKPLSRTARTNCFHPSRLRGLLHQPLRRIKRLPEAFRWRLHQLGIRLLLPAFREQNVSFASIGERHHWLWDFYQVKDALEQIGFSQVTRMSHMTSIDPHFPFYPLDAVSSGAPRKGRESMFIEAINWPTT